LEILREWEEKITDTRTDIAFADYLVQWSEERRAVLADTTYWEYKKTIARQIAPHFSQLGVSLPELKPHHIQTFYNAKIAEGVSANVVLPKKAVFRGGFYSQDVCQMLTLLVKPKK
jgi:hypothetical protein